MKTEYLRTAKHSYMIIREADFVFENYEVQMILHNEISTLLSMQVIVEDGQVAYWYEVSGMQSLEQQYTMTPIDEGRLRTLLVSLCDMKMQMENYMLDDTNIDFSPSMIFYDKNSGQIRFCYIPGYSQMASGGIRGLLEEVLQHLNHMDAGAVRMAYEMYESCVQSDFLVSDCKRCLGLARAPISQSNFQDASQELRLEFEEDEEPGWHTENGRGRRTSREYDRRWGDDIEYSSGFGSHGENMSSDSVYSKTDKERRWHRKQGGNEKKHPETKKKRWEFGKRKKQEEQTSIPDYAQIVQEANLSQYVAETADGWNQTICFSDVGMQKVWELSYQGIGLEENLRIDKFPYIIGKDPKKVDGVLKAPTVSRVHARILGDVECLYMEDYNSTNGTYVNGRLIPMNTPTVLHRGDHIVFATEEYVLIDRQIPKC